MRKKSIVVGLAFLLILSVLSGCGSKSGSQSSSSKKDSVTIALSADISSLNPMKSAALTSVQVFTNIYDQLIKVDSSGKIVPSLAESWKISDDGKTYTFNIKKGVKFSNGDDLKASDVVYSFEAAKKSAYLSSQFDIVSKATATDDYTVQVDLSSADSPFLMSLFDNFFILDQKVVTQAGDSYGDNPVGSGPYKFVKHDSGVDVVLVRNDNYWGTPAAIKNVNFKVITDNNTALIALKTGEIDFLYEVPAVSKNDVSSNKNLQLSSYPTIRLSYVLMNNKAKPFDNAQVRQAINYAVDKNKAMTVGVEGEGTIAAGILSKDIFGYSDITGYDYNVDKAKQLLTQAGYPNGFQVTLKTMDGAASKVAQSIQEDLSKIGITAKIDVGEKNAYIQALQQGNYEMGVISASAGNDADAYNILFGTGSPGNFSQYSNTKVDNLFASGKETTDSSKRIQIYHDVSQTISDDAAIVPLYFSKNLCGANANLTIGHIDLEEIMNVNELSWK